MFEVTRRAFHYTALVYVVINLKPIVPGGMCTARCLHTIQSVIFWPIVDNPTCNILTFFPDILCICM